MGKLFFKNLTDDINIILKRLKKFLLIIFILKFKDTMMMAKRIFEKFLLNISNKFSLPLIATHEVFYLDKDMHEAHDAYLCVG